ncbi:MAG: Gfo/Idh/MocA family oxidoreductase [Candidatus Omnitrophica bacterium]|nr:Gfo/Idh/MocA family oxidoreductase [Candidatus Omnitrophota bacterium]
MTAKIKWGVSGSGGIARRRTIPEGITKARNAELAAVFDTNAAVNQEVAAQYGVQACSSLEELLNQDIDAVYVAAPVFAHAGQVQSCAAAGKHILCEKPLGLDVPQAEAMIQACRQAGVRLGVGFMMRFHPLHQAALKIIQAGRLGKPVYARAQLSCWYPPIPGAWRQDPALGGGGALIDMGSHCIDLLEMFFGPVAKVSCFVNNLVHPYASEDSSVILLSFANGALATVDAFFCVPDNSSKNVLELYGSQGGIVARGTIGQSSGGEMTAYLQETAAGYDAQQARASEQGTPITAGTENLYQSEIEEFSQAIQENREPRVGAEIGLQNQKVIAACYESARTGQAVAIR